MYDEDGVRSALGSFDMSCIVRCTAPLILVLGCSSGSVADAVSPPSPASPGCVAGQTKADDGTCLDAGVPASECGAGFRSDDAGGCSPVLPNGPCPQGQMAVPGETQCRDVAPCEPGTWG